MTAPRPWLLGPTSALLALALAVEALACRAFERSDATGADGADVPSTRSATP